MLDMKLPFLMTPPEPTDYGRLSCRHDRVHTSLYVDPAIFDVEMDKIFNNTWVWVAHMPAKSPAPGNFKMSHVGRQPVIVTRDKRTAKFTCCSIAAATAPASVCEEAAARPPSSSAAIMAWSYDLTGKLRGGAAFRRYDAEFDKARLRAVGHRCASSEYAGTDLRHVPATTSRRWTSISAGQERGSICS